ncbi:KdsC family phosphatase [Alcanivorax limicola]|uniref:KdsC family phosphatase n=1 Tax=Alcanivorax limicola TaxID=2874102 RepID=UPI001CBC16C2|nr:HAD family hydrolase [Alcanivorax limicola]
MASHDTGTHGMGNAALRARARGLKLMAFDVDGVMTDGRLYYGPDGEAFKVFNSLDGHGLKQLAQAGVVLAIITGRNSDMVARRASDLGIAHVIQGREDKGAVLQALAESLQLAPQQVGYAGDDEPDVPALAWAHLAFSVPNGHACAQQAADIVTRQSGGQGAVREICDFILSALPTRTVDTSQ